MTIRAYNGFESDLTILGSEGFVTAGWYVSVVSTHRHQTASGYGGTQSLRLGYADTVSIPTPVVAASDEFQFKVLRDTAGARWFVEFLPSGGTPNITITLDTDGYVRVIRGNTTWGTLLVQSTTVLPMGVWHTLKVRITARSSGRVQVYANGGPTPVADTGAGVNCRYTATDDFSTIRMIGQHAGASDYAYVDDYVHATDGTLPDEAVFCLMLRPNADGATVESTPSTGTSRFATVDEHPVSTTDYNTLSAAGQEDHYGLSDLPAAPGTVFAVRTIAYARGDGSLNQMRGLVKSGSSVTYGTNKSLGGSYSAIVDVFETDPATSAAWTASGVNGMNAGYEAN